MAVTAGLRYVDSDGHILEHPTALPEYTPAKYRDRIWHIETDEDGLEWCVYNGTRTSANIKAEAGVASFDPDEAMLRTTAESPLVGADRIIWASDFPHPDAKFPGVTQELAEALAGLTFEQKRQITSGSAVALYGVGR